MPLQTPRRFRSHHGNRRFFRLDLCCAACLPAFLLCGHCGRLQAQFQEPASDELKMTSDPKAPGAAAVYLYREEEEDDFRHSYSYYARIKVLTEKGKELATVRIPYLRGFDSVTDIQGRTIHSDGTIVPLTAKPADLMDVKVKDFQMDSIVFTLPDVEVGSVLEYRLRVNVPQNRVSKPEWKIQQPFFTHKVHYSFHPYLDPGRYISDRTGTPLRLLLYSSRLNSGDQVNYDRSQDLYTLDLTDVPATPEEDWMPPLNTLEWRVEFYYTNANSRAAFWQDAGKRWEKSVQEFIHPTGAVKQAAAEIVSPQDTDDQKALKIYTAVMKLDNTDFGRKKSEAERKKEKIRAIRRAEDVWKDRSGSGDDITLLYVALARAAGLKAWPVQVVNRDRAIFDNNYLSLDQLDDYLADVNVNGKDIYLDPGQKMCPFGLLHWKHTLAGGLRLSDEGAVPDTTPGEPYTVSVVNRFADLTLDEHGNVKGSLRIGMTGQDALHWRQLTLRDDPDEVKKDFNDSLKGSIPDGVEADFDHFLALDDYTVNLVGIVKVSGSLGTATGKRFFLPGLFFESRAKHPFAAEEKRTAPVDVHYARMEQDRVTYHLPPGFTMESAPQATKSNWPERAILSIASNASGDSVTVNRTLAYNFTLLGSTDYAALHDFYLKVAVADQQQVVLARATAAAKGN